MGYSEHHGNIHIKRGIIVVFEEYLSVGVADPR